jgi:hypothetical protein
LLDPTKASNVAPNFVYVKTPTNLLTLRRTITNSSGSTITSAVIRMTALSEANGVPEPGVSTQPATVALLRLTDPALPSSPVVTAAGTVAVENLSVDAPAGASPGGGLDTTLTIPLSGGLAPGATVNIAFTFDVGNAGTYWFGYDVDALT